MIHCGFDENDSLEETKELPSRRWRAWDGQRVEVNASDIPLQAQPRQAPVPTGCPC